MSLDHTYLQVRRELSKNAVIKGSKIESTGTEEQVQARTTYYRSFSTIVKHNGEPVIGVSITVEVLDGAFSPFVTLRFLNSDENGALYGHTDASVVEPPVLTMYAALKDSAAHWKENGDIPFFKIFENYQTEAHGG